MKKSIGFFLSLLLVTACSPKPAEQTSARAAEPAAAASTQTAVQTTAQASAPAPVPAPNPSPSSSSIAKSTTVSHAAKTLASTAPAPAKKRVPIVIKDESSKNPALSRFIVQLKATVNKKDTKALLAIVSDDVRFTFGDSNGKKEFIKHWKLDKNPQNSPIWLELQDALALGGDFAKGNSSLYFVPYLYLHFPEKYDAFTHAAIIGKDVNVRTSPNLKAKVVAQLSNEVVQMKYPPSKEIVSLGGRTYHWIPVMTLDGKKGYVVEKYVRSSVDYRMGIQKNKAGAWKISLFVTGD
ncbi:SH3 domain-containing protein [Aneurinibacillus tyrosinisolvens]|uniref:SH3 domain-containing protein n=1 Tax=Aneurinibacillus tyrosinisolvens TaxID=1443435 RepID=UPI00063F3A6A|nr:SH3 domain-containing protein [Aneurinibacillus tyrosinisolvens]